MPQKRQAKKELRKGAKRMEANLAVRQDLKTLIKKTRQAIDAREAKDKIEKMLIQVQKGLDKAVKKKVLKKNTGARKLSRLKKYFQKGGAVISTETEKKS